MSEEYISGSDYSEKCCEAKVNKARTVPECENEPIRPVGINGPLVAKIPVVIAEPRIQIDVESEIELEESAIEIKRIKKNLFVEQCKLINIGDPKKGKLFISGFVRKNIEFATADCKGHEKSGISGDIRHTTVKVPFECVTRLEFVNPPIFCKSGFTTETEIFTNKIETCDPCAERILGRDFCHQDFKNVECFSEKVFCELEEVKIFEEDIRKNPVPLGCDFPTEQTFKKFIEKMVIFVKIKVLQNQQVNIPYSGEKCDDNKKDDFKKDDFKKDFYDYTDKWPWLKKDKKDKKKKFNYWEKGAYWNKDNYKDKDKDKDQYCC